jgi:hypothetical protein
MSHLQSREPLEAKIHKCCLVKQLNFEFRSSGPLSIQCTVKSSYSISSTVQDIACDHTVGGLNKTPRINRQAGGISMVDNRVVLVQYLYLYSRTSEGAYGLWMIALLYGD